MSSGEPLDALKGTLAATLEQRGVLAKIRAELRQHVFLALDEQETAQLNGTAGSGASLSPSTRAHLVSKKSRIADLHRDAFGAELLELVKDFCSCYSLEYTHALLNTEAEATSVKVNRKLLADKFGLSQAVATGTQSLLLELIKRQAGHDGGAEESSPSHSHSRSTSLDSRSHSRSTSEVGNSGLGEARSGSPPQVTSPDALPSAAGRSSRALYRESAVREEKETATNEERQREQEKQQAALKDKLSPRGLSSLAPLAPLKKPTLGSLAPLAPLGGSSGGLNKPSLGPLSKTPPSSAAPERNPSPPAATAAVREERSPRDAESTSARSSTSPTAAATSTSYSSSSSSASSSFTAPSSSSAPAAPASSSALDDPLADLDALEASLGLGGGGSGGGRGGKRASQELFMPTDTDSDSEAPTTTATADARTSSSKTSSSNVSSTSSSVSSKPSSLSSLASAPSLTGSRPSGLGSLAPLAPLGGRGGGGATSVERSVDEYDNESFGDAQVEESLEEEIEYASEEEAF